MTSTVKITAGYISLGTGKHSLGAIYPRDATSLVEGSRACMVHYAESLPTDVENSLDLQSRHRYDKMREDEKIFRDWYRPHNRRLARLLGRELPWE